VNKRREWKKTKRRRKTWEEFEKCFGIELWVVGRMRMRRRRRRRRRAPKDCSFGGFV
jgi:hypothetical protein